MREKLLVSACLLGENCRYSGGNNYCPAAAALGERYELIPVCPEVLGGLPTPRAPSERAGERVTARDGTYVTAAFRLGAERVLETALAQGITRAVLKERSPSCGSGQIYDGAFTGRVIPGQGVTAELLSDRGVAVYGESRIHELL